MQISITGGTGLIGQALVKKLTLEGHGVNVITRDLEKAKAIFHDLVTPVQLSEASLSEVIPTSDAIINLAGESIGLKAWTRQRKEKIKSSRVGTTELLVRIIKATKQKPGVFIQGSAIGFYGPGGEKTFTEEDQHGQGFLADLTREWEQCIQPLPALGIRTAVIRTGLVLSAEGGLLKQMLLPFRFFAGGPLGSGKQWLSWIHISDQIEAVKFILENKSANGIFNLTAPSPVRQKEFAQVLGNILDRPFWLKVPSQVLKLVFGERADELLLLSQKVMPVRLKARGFSFEYETLEPALKNLIVK